MAQHARPHWYTHSEYFRLRLSRLASYRGIRPFSTMPISRSHPSQDPFAPGVDETENQDEQEDGRQDDLGEDDRPQ